MTTFIKTLRSNLAASKDAKDVSRKAGEGVFANYVRATCFEQTIHNVEQLENVHKNVVADLSEIADLSKEEKNSLRSAKCTVAKAIVNGIDVWQRDEHGYIVHDDGIPMPKGKSELNTAKTDFQLMLSLIESASKKFYSESRDVFTTDEQKQLADAYASLAHAMIEQMPED